MWLRKFVFKFKSSPECRVKFIENLESSESTQDGSVVPYVQHLTHSFRSVRVDRTLRISVFRRILDSTKARLHSMTALARLLT